MSSENIEKILDMITVRYLGAYLSLELASQSDSWTKRERPQRKDPGSHLEKCWLFQIVHRTSIIETASIIEERRNYKQSANLKHLCSECLKLDFDPEISIFYKTYSSEIKTIMDIRDGYIGHTDLNPKSDSSINSYKVTKRILDEIEKIILKIEFHFQKNSILKTQKKYFIQKLTMSNAQRMFSDLAILLK